MATTVREFLDLLDRYRQFSAASTDPEQALRQLSEPDFRNVVLATAVLFGQLRREAERRGIWDDLKTTKPK